MRRGTRSTYRDATWRSWLYLRTIGLSEGALEIAAGSILVELDPDLFGYQLEVNESGEFDELVVGDPTGKLTTRLNLNGATIALVAVGTPKAGEYQLLNVENIFGEAMLVVPDELMQVFDTSRLLSAGILIVLGNNTFDCNADGTLDVQDLNCTAAEQLSEVLDAAGLIQGDANGDGEVAFNDFLLLSANFGTPGNYTEGDFNKDGMVAFTDFLVLSNNFGKSVESLASVPEPINSLLPLLVTAVGLISGSRRQRPSTFTQIIVKS